MNQARRSRVVLFVLCSAAVFDVCAANCVRAQNSSQLRKTSVATSVRSSLGGVRARTVKPGKSAARVRQQARSQCMDVGQYRSAPVSQAANGRSPGFEAHAAIKAKPKLSVESSFLAYDKSVEDSTQASRTPDLPIRPNRKSASFITELARLSPPLKVSELPTLDPVQAALTALLGREMAPRGMPGGIWLSGDVRKGMDLLRWIAGIEHGDMFYLDQDRRLGFHTEMLAKEAGADKLDRTNSAVVIADYLASNEGLLLIAQISQGKFRYELHVGNSAPTMAGPVQVTSALNLDNNFDSRVNPRRRDGQKVRTERPPEGFDSLVAVNPTTVWFSLRAKRVVPLESVAFHELAEAHGKVALRLQYLPADGQPGAHDVAIERELRFHWQRPFSGAELTLGLIQVFTNEAQ